MARKRAGSLPPRRPPPGPPAGGRAHHPEGRRGGVDAARSRREAWRLAHGPVPPFRRQVGAAGGGGQRGVSHAPPRACRKPGKKHGGGAQGLRGDGRRVRALRRRASVALPGHVRRASSEQGDQRSGAGARRRRRVSGARGRHRRACRQQGMRAGRTIRSSWRNTSGPSCTASRCSPSTASSSSPSTTSFGSPTTG